MARVSGAAWCGGSEAFARRERSADGAVVEIIQLAANGNTLRERCERNPAVKLIGDVMRGGLAIDRGVEREDHLGDLFGLDPVHEFRYAQRLGSDLIERRQRATKHVIAPLEGLTAFHRPEVGYILDHADLAVGAFWRGADIAGLHRADIAAGGAFARGVSSSARLRIMCSTAGRAGRGPSPGRRAIMSIRASMSRVLVNRQIRFAGWGESRESISER